MFVYVVVGLVGALGMLAGVLQHLNWLIPIGGLVVLGSFAWFLRTQTSTPVDGAGKKP